MGSSNQITFIYKNEDKAQVNTIYQYLSAYFKIKKYECETWENLGTLPEGYLIVSRDFMDYVEAETFSYMRDQKVIIKDGGQEYDDVNLVFAITQYIKNENLKTELASLSEVLEGEILRLQNWYRKYSPMRIEKAENFYFCSKYKTGSMPGGDFFDVIERDDQFVIIMTSTNSYLLSSRVIEIISHFRESVRGDIKILLNHISKAREAFASSSSATELDFFVMGIQKKSFEYEGYNFGHTDFCDTTGIVKISSNDFPVEETFFENARFSGKCRYGDKWVISSKGVIANWSEKQALRHYYTELKKNKPAKEILEAIFLSLYEQESLKYDSALMWMEVNQYGIREV